MPELAVNKTLLMNHGLGFGAFTPGLGLPELDADKLAADPVLAFKDVLAKNPLGDEGGGMVEAVAAANASIDLASFFITEKFNELGGASGPLGTTIGAILPAKNKNGFVRPFKDGLITWHPDVGVHAIHGPIRAKWLELGGEDGFLGFPTSDVTTGTDVNQLGTFAHFQGGSIYWTPVHTFPQMTTAVTKAGELASEAFVMKSDLSANFATARMIATGINLGDITGAVIVAESSAGAFEVHGAIREKYLAMGAEASILGYPRTDETGTPDGIGRFNHFQSGSIYWTPGTGAQEVHGLIRDFWATNGWERNPQLGYPVTDELIPDPRIGNRRPEVRKKPILNIPLDVIKLPAEAMDAGFPATVVNSPKSLLAEPVAVPRAAVIGKRDFGVAASDSPLGKLSEKVSVGSSAALDIARPFEIGPVLGGFNTPASTPAAERSVNRFSDFESGVLFWQRGSTTARALSPLSATSDGTDLSFTGAEIANLALGKIGLANLVPAGAQLMSMTFAGTTSYSHDGAQVHNRRHRMHLILLRQEQGLFGLPLPVTATVEVQIEVWFEATQRKIVLAPVEWSLLQSGSGAFANAIVNELHAKLDPLLWVSHELITLPDTDNGAPIAILSVKTMANGAVGVFVEPHGHLVFAVSEIFTSAVAPVSIRFNELIS